MVRGSFWVLVTTFAGQGGSLLGTVIVARLLGHEGFGRLAILQSLVATLASLAATGLGTTATKFISELRCGAPDRVGRVLGACAATTCIVGAVFAIGQVMAAPWIASYVLGADELCPYVQISAIYVFFFAMNSYQVGALSGFEAFSRLASVQCIQGPVILLLTAGLTWSLGLRGAVLGMALGMLGSWVLHQRALRAECRRQGVRIHYDGMGQEIGGLFRFALPATVSGCLGGLAIVGAGVLLVRQPGGFASMAIFGAANTIRTVVLLVPNIVTRVSSPMLCNLRASGDSRRYRQSLWYCLGFSSGLTGLAALALFPLSSLVLSLFGGQFAQGSATLHVLLAAAVAEVIAVLLFQSLYSHGWIWTQCAIQAVWSLVLLASTQHFHCESGATNLALGYLMAWTCSAFLYGLVTWRLLRPSASRAPLVQASATA